MRRAFMAVKRSLPGRLLLRYSEHQGSRWAVVIAWNMLFSMFPMVLTIVTILGYVFSLSGLKGIQTRAAIFTIIPNDPPQNLREHLVNSVPHGQNTSLFGLIAIAGLVWGGSALFGAMEEAFAGIYGTRPRPFIRQKLMAIGMIVIFAVLVLLSIATSALLAFIEHLPFLPSLLQSNPGALITQIGVGVASGLLLFGTIYYVVPNRRQHLRDVWPGALFAAILFEALSLVFPFYLRFAHPEGVVGQGFALLFVLLTYLLFLGMITMLGAELNNVLQSGGKGLAARSL